MVIPLLKVMKWMLVPAVGAGVVSTALNHLGRVEFHRGVRQNTGQNSQSFEVGMYLTRTNGSLSLADGAYSTASLKMVCQVRLQIPQCQSWSNAEKRLAAAVDQTSQLIKFIEDVQQVYSSGKTKETEVFGQKVKITPGMAQEYRHLVRTLGWQTDKEPEKTRVINSTYLGIKSLSQGDEYGYPDTAKLAAAVTILKKRGVLDSKRHGSWVDQKWPIPHQQAFRNWTREQIEVRKLVQKDKELRALYEQYESAFRRNIAAINEGKLSEIWNKCNSKSNVKELEKCIASILQPEVAKKNLSNSNKNGQNPSNVRNGKDSTGSKTKPLDTSGIPVATTPIPVAPGTLPQANETTLRAADRPAKLSLQTQFIQASGKNLGKDIQGWQSMFEQKQQSLEELIQIEQAIIEQRLANMQIAGELGQEQLAREKKETDEKRRTLEKWQGAYGRSRRTEGMRLLYH